MNFDIDLVPGHIGKIVSIQVFDKSGHDDGLIKPETLKKFVGKLMNYVITPQYTYFTLEGAGALTMDRRTEYYEVYIHER